MVDEQSRSKGSFSFSFIPYAIVGSDGTLSELGTLFAIGISISAIMLGLKVVRGVVWGA